MIYNECSKTVNISVKLIKRSPWQGEQWDFGSLDPNWMNKEEFRSRPISAFVDIFALSQSECVIGYYFR
jgi:hypothetical protein